MAMGIVKCLRFHEQDHENLQPEEHLSVFLCDWADRVYANTSLHTQAFWF